MKGRNVDIVYIFAKESTGQLISISFRESGYVCLQHHVKLLTLAYKLSYTKMLLGTLLLIIV